MKESLFERYEQLNVDTSLIGLEKTDSSGYSCDPIGAKVFAGLGVDGVHFCFIDGFGEMVFSINPFAYNNQSVNPLASTFEDFLGLVLTCKNSNLPELIYNLTREEFDNQLEKTLNDPFEKDETEAVLAIIQTELNITPIAEPYDYVRKVQTSFDYSQIKYSDEYYELTGIDKPNK